MDHLDHNLCRHLQLPSDLFGAAEATTEPENLPEDECFIGVSAQIAALKQFVELQAARLDPVLLVGERGLRQEQIARALHERSARRTQPLLIVNAVGLSAEDVRRLLFGPHDPDSPGTIYLDEFTELPHRLQCILAARLQDQAGKAESGALAGPRLIIATAGEPVTGRAGGRLLESLIESLCPSSFRLQPLRERGEDIPYLATHLAARIAQRLNKGPCLIEPEAMKVLAQYAWAGNIAELEAILESTIAHLPPQRINITLLPSCLHDATLRPIPEEGIYLRQAVADYEKALIEAALRQAGGKQNKAAKMLGLRAQTLNAKLKRFAEKRR